MVSADQQVYATVDLGSSNPTTGETYNGVDSTLVASTASVPSVFQSYYGFNSNIVVQNTNPTTTNSVTVTFIGQSSNGAVNFTTSPATVIPASSSFTFDLASYAAQLGNQFTGAGNRQRKPEPCGDFEQLHARNYHQHSQLPVLIRERLWDQFKRPRPRLRLCLTRITALHSSWSAC